MKSILGLLLMSSQLLIAQVVDRTNFRAGVHGGVTVGDFSEAYSLILGLDIYHHWGISREVDMGIAIGFSNAFGKKKEFSQSVEQNEAKFDNLQFVPLAGSVRMYPASGFKLGADVGFALGITDGHEGGLYYRPTLGIEMSRGTQELTFSYYAVKGDIKFSSVVLGILMLF